MLNEPLITAMLRTVIRRGISYAVNCAAERIPPIIEYLLLEAQPDVKTPIGAMENAAIITIKPAGAEDAANEFLQKLSHAGFLGQVHRGHELPGDK